MFQGEGPRYWIQEILGDEMTNDPLADAINVIKSHERAGIGKCKLTPASKTIKSVLSILQQNNYIGDFEFVDDGKSGYFNVILKGKINKCAVIKPRMSVKFKEWTVWEQRYLPSKNIGLLIVSTPKGIMSHKQAQESKLGGKLLVYVY